MNKILLIFALFLLPLPLVAEVASEEPIFQPLGPETLVQTAGAGQLGVTEWRYTDISGQSLGLHRYRFPSVPTRAVLFYLPGTNMNGTLKTLNERENLWIYLAARGIQVYTMDYRTRFVAPDHEGDLNFMLDWTVELFIEDALLAWQTARAVTPDVPAFVVGFSRGASYAYLLAGKTDFQGLVALDGDLKSLPQKPFDAAFALAQFDEENRPASVLSRRGFAARDELMRNAIEDPNGPARDDRYETAAEQLAEVLYQAWGPGALSNTRDSITRLETLATEMRAYDWFFPRIQNIEYGAIAARDDDPSTSLDDHFGKSEIPVLYFGAGRFGPDWLINGIHSASAFSKPRAQIHVLENYGHLDVLFSRTAAKDVYGVIDQWVSKVLSQSQVPPGP